MILSRVRLHPPLRKASIAQRSSFALFLSLTSFMALSLLPHSRLSSIKCSTIETKGDLDVVVKESRRRESHRRPVHALSDVAPLSFAE